MADELAARPMEGIDLSLQLARFISDNKSSHERRARYAAILASELKAKIDLLRERSLVLPSDLQRGIDQMRLGELQTARDALRKQLQRLDAEEQEIERPAAPSRRSSLPDHPVGPVV